MNEVKRNLGNEWKEWDGKIINPESSVNLFLSLISIATVVFILLIYFILYMIFPGLANIHTTVQSVTLYATHIIAIASLLWLILLLAGYKFGNLKIIDLCNNVLEFKKAFIHSVKIGNLFSINRDRIANSYVKFSNRVIELKKSKFNYSEIITILPRCLSPENIKKIRDISSKFDIKTFVVPGGTLARKRVKENKPKAIIAVACERDLIAFLKDVPKNILIYGIPNMRPTGPCVDTTIDLDEYKKGIGLLHN